MCLKRRFISSKDDGAARKEENNALKKEGTGWRDCFDIVETAKAGESLGGENVTTDEVEKEEKLVVCETWACCGRCRHDSEGRRELQAWPPLSKGGFYGAEHI